MRLTDRDIARLPSSVQRQLASAKKSKYNNRKTTQDGIRFDSQKEQRRYNELMPMLRAGIIQSLRLQPEYTLQEAYTTPDGQRIQAIRYRADFSYTQDGQPVVEDVKGVRTDVYKLKRKMMQDKHGIAVTEV